MAINDSDHGSIGDSGDDSTMTDNGSAVSQRAPSTRVMQVPPLTTPSARSSSSQRSEALGSAAFADRFVRKELLGRGGMGEVSLWRDDRLGREVAVKRLLPHAVDDEVARARFLREARVQGQLEHPGVVPVYDLQQDGDGGLSLTMKRVRGKTLAQLLDDHRKSDVGTTVPRRLLSAFASVCLAVEFAHDRGIVHRDLKPGNIMLGDFGEVYVLDWGLAKILGEPNDDDVGVAAGSLSPAAMTQSGSVLGTLGYMAPEQLDEGLGAVSAATDVYALGAILFELLAGVPLLVASSSMELMQRTLQGVDARARVRAPARDVPPELEDVCVIATQRLALERRLSARAIHDAVEGYLEGDRDLSRRRALAATHIEQAEAWLQRGRTNDAVEEQARATAMRELGSALALDPRNPIAGRAVLKLMADPPRTIPAAVVAEIEAIDQLQIQEGARVGSPMLLGWLGFLCFGFVMPLRDGRPIAVMAVVVVMSLIMTFINARSARVSLWRQGFMFSLLALLCVTSSFIAGPLVGVPTLIATFVAALQTHPAPAMRRVVAVVGTSLFLAMVGLEWAGVLPTSYVFVDGALHILPVAVEFPPTATRLLLVLSALSSIMATALFVASVRGALATAQARNSVLAWHLRQLVPDNESSSS